MIVSNNNEDENDNRPRDIIRGNAVHQNSIYWVSGETLRVEDKYRILYKIKARDLTKKSVNLSTNYTA